MLDKYAASRPRFYLTCENFHYERLHADVPRIERSKTKWIDDDQDKAYKNDKQIESNLKKIEKKKTDAEKIDKAKRLIAERLENQGVSEDLEKFKQMQNKVVEKDKKLNQ